MSKRNAYLDSLNKLADWIPLLKQESGLPGPRGNLELAHAVAQAGNKKQFEQLLSFGAEENTPEVFLVALLPAMTEETFIGKGENLWQAKLNFRWYSKN